MDQEFVKYIVSSLVSQPEAVKVERIVDERGILLILHVAEDDLGRVIGRKGTTAHSLRVLLRALGSKNSAHYNLRIADGGEHDSKKGGAGAQPVESTVATAQALPGEMPDFPAAEDLMATPETDDSLVVQAEKQEDSLLDKTKKEFDHFNDLDI